MKPLQTTSSLEKQQIKRKRIGGIVIIGLLLLSTLGFAISSTGITKQKKPEGLQYDGQYWTYFVSGIPRYRFAYGLEDLNFENLSLAKTLSDFENKNLFIDSDDSSPIQEIASNLGNHVSKISEACYGSCSKDVPELSCDTEGVLVVIKPEGNSVTENENCIFINGDLKKVDAFLYKLLGLN